MFCIPCGQNFSSREYELWGSCYGARKTLVLVEKRIKRIKIKFNPYYYCLENHDVPFHDSFNYSSDASHHLSSSEAEIIPYIYVASKRLKRTMSISEKFMFRIWKF